MLNKIKSEPESVRKAQHQIGIAMGLVLNAWFVPVVSGIACNWMEKKLVRQLLVTLGEDSSEGNVNAVFWFIRKRMLLFNAATYIPFVGPVLQLLEVYAIGQFTIKCAMNSEDSFVDEEFMRQNWSAVEESMFSGENVAESYHQFTGKPFPESIRPHFVKTVDLLSSIYRSAERAPGVEVSQEFVGEKMRQIVGKGLETFAWARGKVVSPFISR